MSIGGQPASDVNVISSDEIRATTPSGSAGPADVTVQNPDGSADTMQGGFDYRVIPPAGPVFRFRVLNRSFNESVANVDVEVLDNSNVLVRGRTNQQGRVNLDLTGVPDGTFRLRITPPDHTADPVGPDIASTVPRPERIWRALDTTVSVRGEQVIDVADVSPNEMEISGNRIIVKLQPVWMRSPNQSSRPVGVDITHIVVHHTAGFRPVPDHFVNPPPRSSAHYVVATDGQVVKMVHESEQSWHAGCSHWEGREHVNRFSVGIEIVHRSGPYPQAQYDALIDLLNLIQTAHSIPANHIVGHSDIGICIPGNPHCNCLVKRLGRKASDPGLDFEWTFLENAGLGIIERPDPQPPTIYGGFFTVVPNGRLQSGDNDANQIYGGRRRPSITTAIIDELQTDLSDIGYFCPVDGSFGQQTAWAVRMFQDHFFSGRRRRSDPGFRRGQVDLLTAETIKSVR